MSFNENLKRIRKRAKITRKEIAAALDIHPNAYGMYETGAREPSIDKLVVIASILHVTTDELLGYQLDTFNMWIDRLKIFYDVEIDGEKITISERQRELAPLVFSTRKEFIEFANTIESSAKEEYEKNLSHRLADYIQMGMMFATGNETREERKKRLFPRSKRK